MSGIGTALQCIAERREANMKLWTELMWLVDKTDIIRLALEQKPERAKQILAQIAVNDGAVVDVTRTIVQTA